MAAAEPWGEISLTWLKERVFRTVKGAQSQMVFIFSFQLSAYDLENEADLAVLSLVFFLYVNKRKRGGSL